MYCPFVQGPGKVSAQSDKATEVAKESLPLTPTTEAAATEGATPEGVPVVAASSSTDTTTATTEPTDVVADASTTGAVEQAEVAVGAPRRLAQWSWLRV
jgi:hypothetical protein